MSNFSIKGPPLLRSVQSLTKCFQSRGYIDHRKHFEPADQKWQWVVRDDPTIHYPQPCITKKCPKKTFFPKFKKQYVPKEVESCKRVQKPMTWKEYFSYLLPEKMQKPRPPVNSCKKMMDLKRKLCSDPRIPVCKLPPLPTEWECQGVVKDIVSYCQPSPPTVVPKPCPPPSHILPRCLLVKKGVCITKGAKVPPCLEAYAVQFPHNDLLRARKRAAMSAPKPFVLKCNKTCYPQIPPVHDKSSRLACRHCAEFKRVECPKQLYTRYKSVEVPKPCFCVGARVPELKPTSATSASCCPKRGLHTGPNLMETRRSLSTSTIKVPVCDIPKTKVEPSRLGSGTQQPQQRSYFWGLFGRSETKPEVIGTRGIATGVPLSANDKCDKKDEKKEEQICAGCPGIKAAAEEDEDRVKPPIDCKMRAAGTCPGPKKERGPDDPPISNPYWDNKGVYLSPCNQPRDPPCPRPPPPPMPCDENKKKRKLHTSAIELPAVDDKKESLKQNDWILLSEEKKETECDDGEEEGEKESKEEEEKPKEIEEQKDSEEIEYPKFDPHDVERASCFPKIPKKDDKDQAVGVKTKSTVENYDTI